MDLPSRPTTGYGVEAGLSLATGGTLGTLSGKLILLYPTTPQTYSRMTPFEILLRLIYCMSQL